MASWQIGREKHFGMRCTELFASIDALVEAARAFFDRYNRKPGGVGSIIGAHAT